MTYLVLDSNTDDMIDIVDLDPVEKKKFMQEHTGVYLQESNLEPDLFEEEWMEEE